MEYANVLIPLGLSLLGCLGDDVHVWEREAAFEWVAGENRWNDDFSVAVADAAVIRYVADMQVLSYCFAVHQAIVGVVVWQRVGLVRARRRRWGCQWHLCACAALILELCPLELTAMSFVISAELDLHRRRELPKIQSQCMRVLVLLVVAIPVFAN